MSGKYFWATVLAAALLLAQGERGTFNGTVTDPSGAVVPGATVKAVNVATNVEIQAQTTTAGVYRMPYLPPGTYRLTVTAPGFKTAVRENVVLSVAQTLTVDFTLEVGAVTDTVTVSAETPLLETGTAEIGSYVTKKEFDTWPITVGDGRRQIQQFIFSSLPGTVGGTFLGSINGGQGYTHEILIDGISIGRMDLQGGSNNEFSPSAESVSEFKLQTGMTSAQYSGGQTAVANFATKSGTNEIHGSVYEYNRNSYFSANDYFIKAAQLGSDKPNKPQQLNRNIFGASLGGPIMKDRLFLFLNYEGYRDAEAISVVRTVPTAAFRDGVVQYLCPLLSNGNLDTSGCPGNTVQGISNANYTAQPGYFALGPAQLTKMDQTNGPAGTPLGYNPAVIAYMQKTFKSFFPNDATTGDLQNTAGYRFAAPTTTKKKWY
ncbi:MAG: carboxypeptidase-like regulatory domain-containing protein, partial [Bryobacteraceae bacterium]|nr:carboxypeptidase-like regulatory domain-containing protein [Bryobacteraceae bacterium]